MASAADILPSQLEHCPKHSGRFTLEYFCSECQITVCLRCLVLEHHEHEYIKLKVRTEEERKNITELEEDIKDLQKRSKEVRNMKRNCQEMSKYSHEVAEGKLTSIERESERKRQCVELERNDFDRCISSVSKSLEKEEDELYSLQQSSEQALLNQRDPLNNCSLKDMHVMQEEIKQRTCSKLPRMKTFTDLQDRFNKYKIMAESHGEGKGEESNADDILLYDLAMQILPINFTPLGLRLHLSNIVLKQIQADYSQNIVESIYQLLQKWKGTISTGVLKESHFEQLEQCLRKIQDNHTADWLLERLQKSKGQFVQPCPLLGNQIQPSSSPGQLVQPSQSPGQLVQPSQSPGQTVQPSSSPGHLVQPSSSPGQLVQPSSSPGLLVQPSSSPGHLVQPSSSPGQTAQPSSSPGQLVQPSSSPGQLVQPSPFPGQTVQPSSSSGKLAEPLSSPGQLAQPSPSSGKRAQPLSSPGQLVQPSSSPGHLEWPSSSPDQLAQHSSLGQQ